MDDSVNLLVAGVALLVLGLPLRAPLLLPEPGGRLEPTPPRTDGRTSFMSVTAGGLYTCALTDTGAPYCWGYEDASQLAGRAGAFSGVESVPVRISRQRSFRDISAGGRHICAISKGDEAYCWGSGQYGVLGNGDVTDQAGPTPVSQPGARFTQVAAGLAHTCAMDVEGAVYCWGSNDYGQLGAVTDGSGSTEPVRTDRMERAVEVTAGSFHSCALLRDGSALCWGENSDGQLGIGEVTESRSEPSETTAGLTFSALSAGHAHTCGLTPDGLAYCWGSNDAGQLGDGTTSRRVTPTLVSKDLVFEQISAGHHHTCAVDSEGRVYCWGANGEGQLGDATTHQRLKPVAVAGGFRFREVTAGQARAGGGGKHTCAISTRGTVYCWGQNGEGQLGDGTISDRYEPVPVVTP